MPRVYKTIRFAYETKYWLDELVQHRTEQLRKSIREDGLADRIDAQLLKLNEKDLDGVSVNVTLNVTAGSVIEQAVRFSRGTDAAGWKKLASEAEAARRGIKASTEDATPRLYINEDIYRELEDLQAMLGDERNARLSYVIKLAVYNLYKHECK